MDVAPAGCIVGGKESRKKIYVRVLFLETGKVGDEYKNIKIVILPAELVPYTLEPLSVPVLPCIDNVDGLFFRARCSHTRRQHCLEQKFG